MVAPVDNTEKVKYYLMRCTSQKMRLLEDFDDNGFIYERGFIVLKGYFFKKPIKTILMFTLNTTSQMSQVVNIVIWYVQHA
jgi:hypothetical protein